MTAAIFRASEILDMAIRIERQGIAFYSACRERVDAPGLEETFSWLIEQENAHVEIFSDMKQGLDDFRLPESFDGEYESHLEAFVGGKVFSAPEEAEEQARRLPDSHAVVDWAVGFERNSIAFYKLVKDRVRSSEQAAIDGIIREEERHIEQLRQLRRNLRADPAGPGTG